MNAEYRISFEKSLAAAGVTLAEVLVAVSVLAFGMVPIFTMFSETRRVTNSSITELKATSMASSMVAGIMRVPGRLIDPRANAQIAAGYFDEDLPPEIGLASIGVPVSYPGLKRHVQVNLVNTPALPGERFTNPWGRVVEINVTVSQKTPSHSGHSTNGGKSIFELKCYRELEIIP